MGDDIETGASAAPTVDAATTSPAPSEPSSAPEKPSLFQSLMAEGEDSGEDQGEEPSTDGEGTEPAEGEEPLAETPEAEKPKEEEQPQDDADVPKDLRAVLKKFPELRAAHFYKRDLDAIGFTVEEAEEYRRNIPSLQDLRMTVDRARQLDGFEGLFTHTAPDATEKFLEGLRMVDGSAADRLVRHIATNLPKVAPDAYLEMGGKVWETGLANLDAIAGADPYRKEAVQVVRDMVAELVGKAPEKPAAQPQKPLQTPDAEELSERRAHEEKARQDWWNGLRAQGNRAADAEVRRIFAEVEKRRDPDGLLVDDATREQIIHDIHRTISGSGAVNELFLQALHDTSIPPDQRIAKAAALIGARARNVADLVFREKTKGIADRVKRVSQQKLAKAAKVVSIREATGGRPASTPAAPVPRGARVTSKDIFRAVMKG